MTALKAWRNAKIACFANDEPWGGWLEQGSLLTDGDEIVWLGKDSQIPAEYRATIAEEQNLQGLCVTPGLVDCHTHLVYAGNRAREFELRLEGASYEEIAKAGGGIRSTVAATRAASDETLLTLAIERAHCLMQEGVTTLEVKSGYGLSEQDEARTLRVARRLGERLPLTAKTTCLAAHALPPEFANDADGYINAVCEWLPRLHGEGLVDAVDAFCENIGFTPEQTRKVFAQAQSLGIPVKLHAEQLSDQGGATLAATFGALSCDHLEYLSEDGVKAMAAAGTVAVLLPGAYYFLREKQLPPMQWLRQYGVPIALSTDHNPGTSPTLSPLLMMNMGCTLFRMTPEEVWRAVTINAARALGLQATHGALRVGAKADFAVWDAEHPRDLAYRFGHRPLRRLIKNGQEVSLL